MIKNYKNILNATVYLSAVLFATLTFAQTSQTNAERIGNCVAGIQVSLNKYNYPPDKLPQTSVKMYDKYIGTIGNLNSLVKSQCPNIEPSCVRRALKNNNDFEMMNEYYDTVTAAMRGMDKTALLALGTTSCALIK